MIKVGSNGSICFYYKGLLICGWGLSEKKTVEQYLYQGEYIIMKSKGVPIMTQIKTYRMFCNTIYKRKLNKQPIRKSDLELFVSSLMALLRLRIIENDESNGYMNFSKKKTSIS